MFVKDWRSELRTRFALNTLGLFALTTLVVVSFALGPIGASPLAPAVLPAVLWIILLFAATAGLPRLFVAEEETHTATALRLAATPSALFCGKLAFGLTLIAAIELLTTPLFLALVQLRVALAGAAGGDPGRRRLRPGRRLDPGGDDGGAGAGQGDAVRGAALPGAGAAADHGGRATRQAVAGEPAGVALTELAPV